MRNFIQNKFIFLLKHPKLHLLILTTALLLGTYLRFYNLNWDQGYLFHPDETNIALAISKTHFSTKLDPQFYAYGGFSIYLGKGIAEIISKISSNPEWTSNLGNINLILRYISASASTLSILLIYFVSKEFLYKKYAAITAFLLACTVGLIQHAHFGVTESLLVFFLLLISYISLKIFKNPKSLFLWYLLSAICGIAIGTKTSALAFLAIPFFTWLILFLKQKSLNHIYLGFFFVFNTFLFFFFTSPYSFLNYEALRYSMKYEGGVVDGSVRVFYTLQFANQNILLTLQNLFWQTNLLIPILGFSGLIIWIYKIIKDRSQYEVLPMLIFTVFYFGYIAQWYTRFIRYTIPVLPVLIIACVWLFQWIIKNEKLKVKNAKPVRILVSSLLTLTIIITGFWSFAFTSIYRKESTRITASKWILQNIPANSTIVTEQYDNRLPIYVKNNLDKEYQFLEMLNYESESKEKEEMIISNVVSGDYIILASTRLYQNIPRNPEKYPFTSKYYEKLLNGELGYEKIQEFTSYPELFGLKINDDNAEETIKVFDHPNILIYKNSKKLSKENIQAILYN